MNRGLLVVVDPTPHGLKSIFSSILEVFGTEMYQLYKLLLDHCPTYIDPDRL